VLKKTIKYPDLDGNEVVKDFWFHMSKAEIAEMSLDGSQGMKAELEKIVARNNVSEIANTYKEIVRKAVGRREGQRFVKDDEARSELFDTEAYSELFMELITDVQKSVDFIRGIIPSDVADRAMAKMAEDGLTIEGWVQPERSVQTIDAGIVTALNSPPAEKKTLEQYNRAELLEMPDDQFYDLVGTDSRKYNKQILGIAMARRAGSAE